MAEMRGICTTCEFQVKGNTLDELDMNFSSHFEDTGHETYYTEQDGQGMERNVS